MSYTVWVDSYDGGWTPTERADLDAVLAFITGDIAAGRPYRITQDVPVRLVDDRTKPADPLRCGLIGPKNYPCTKPRGHPGGHLAAGTLESLDDWTTEAGR